MTALTAAPVFADPVSAQDVEDDDDDGGDAGLWGLLGLLGLAGLAGSAASPRRQSPVPDDVPDDGWRPAGDGTQAAPPLGLCPSNTS